VIKKRPENALYHEISTDDLISIIVTRDKGGKFNKLNRCHVSALKDISIALDSIGAWEHMCMIMKEDADLNCPNNKTTDQNWAEICKGDIS
jgi:hypothetical protein